MSVHRNKPPRKYSIFLFVVVVISSVNGDAAVSGGYPAAITPGSGYGGYGSDLARNNNGYSITPAALAYHSSDPVGAALSQVRDDNDEVLLSPYSRSSQAPSGANLVRYIILKEYHVLQDGTMVPATPSDTYGPPRVITNGFSAASSGGYSPPSKPTDDYLPPPESPSKPTDDYLPPSNSKPNDGYLPPSGSSGGYSAPSRGNSGGGRTSVRRPSINLEGPEIEITKVELPDDSEEVSGKLVAANGGRNNVNFDDNKQNDGGESAEDDEYDDSGEQDDDGDDNDDNISNAPQSQRGNSGGNSGNTNNRPRNNNDSGFQLTSVQGVSLGSRNKRPQNSNSVSTDAFMFSEPSAEIITAPRFSPGFAATRLNSTSTRNNFNSNSNSNRNKGNRNKNRNKKNRRKNRNRGNSTSTPRPSVSSEEFGPLVLPSPASPQLQEALALVAQFAQQQADLLSRTKEQAKELAGSVLNSLPEFGSSSNASDSETELIPQSMNVSITKLRENNSAGEDSYAKLTSSDGTGGYPAALTSSSYGPPPVSSGGFGAAKPNIVANIHKGLRGFKDGLLKTVAAAAVTPKGETGQSTMSITLDSPDFGPSDGAAPGGASPAAPALSGPTFEIIKSVKGRIISQGQILGQRVVGHFAGKGQKVVGHFAGKGQRAFGAVQNKGQKVFATGQKVVGAVVGKGQRVVATGQKVVGAVVGKGQKVVATGQRAITHVVGKGQRAFGAGQKVVGAVVGKGQRVVATGQKVVGAVVGKGQRALGAGQKVVGAVVNKGKAIKGHFQHTGHAITATAATIVDTKHMHLQNVIKHIQTIFQHNPALTAW